MPIRFAKVNNNLYRGGEPNSLDLKMLKDLFNIERIVSLDGEIAQKIASVCKELGFEHVILGLDGPRDPKILQLLNFAPRLADKKTFVHCRHGKDRTGIAVAVYRLSQGAKLKGVLDEAANFGMGTGLSNRDEWFDVIEEFAEERDVLDARDAVTMAQRDTANSAFVPSSSGVRQTDRYQFALSVPESPGSQPLKEPPMNPAGENYYSQKQAGNRMYAAVDRPFSPKVFWYPSKAQAKNKGKGNKIWSCEMNSSGNYQRYRGAREAGKRYGLINSLDAVIYGDNVVFVIDPGCLENIIEEGVDINDLSIGLQDNYDSHYGSPFPGSSGTTSTMGGMAGNASGIVISPGNVRQF